MSAEPEYPAQSVSGERTWRQFRDLMPIANQWAYFDHAAVAPLPNPTNGVMTRWLEDATNDGDVAWPRWSQRIEDFRHTVAHTLHATPSEIAFVPNTTAGLNLLAEGFAWQSGDNVVTLENEFPSNLYPWLQLAERGVTTRLVATENGRVDLNRIADACDDRTRVISLSWVGYASGWRIDVAAAVQMAHDHGAVFCLDAIQGLGVYPLDVQATGVDFLSADGHKWLLGPEGAGVCYIASRLLDRLRPLGVGWNSVEHRYDFGNPELRLRHSAARYEGGSTNMVGYHGLAASWDMLVDWGWGPSRSAVADRVIALADRTCERLASLGCFPRFQRDPAHKSAIVTVDIPQVPPQTLRTACLENHVVVSCRGGGIRLAPHAYNNEQDIDRFVQVVERFL
jgi:selenocysteine lyase/cysteine desulfurase